MNVLEWNECSVNFRWMFAEHSREQSRENECSWMIKNVRKTPLAFSHKVLSFNFWRVLILVEIINKNPKIIF